MRKQYNPRAKKVYHNPTRNNGDERPNPKKYTKKQLHYSNPMKDIKAPPYNEIMIFHTSSEYNNPMRNNTNSEYNNPMGENYFGAYNEIMGYRGKLYFRRNKPSPKNNFQKNNSQKYKTNNQKKKSR